MGLKKKAFKSKKGQSKSALDITHLVTESAGQIWLAGLGAFSKAQSEGGKLFSALIEEGQAIEKLGKSATQAAASQVSQSVEKAVSGIKTNTHTSIEKLEDVFQNRVANALNSLGIPSRDDISQLNEKISQLTEEVKSLRTTETTKKEKVTRKKIAD